MGRKKAYTPEEIVAKLRQMEVLAAQGKAVAEAVRAICVTWQKLCDELLRAEISTAAGTARAASRPRPLSKRGSTP